MENKSLDDMANEYAQSAAEVEHRIDECRAAIKKAHSERRSMRVSKLERNLSVLYAQHNELCCIEQHLRGYYDKEVRPAV